jgi:hypothetical protein
MKSRRKGTQEERKKWETSKMKSEVTINRKREWKEGEKEEIKERRQKIRKN